MYLCLRVDLDYVPWDTPDAMEFGHGEPAVTLRMLEAARQLGLKLHFFASERVLRAFPTASDAILNDGHHLDWLSKHPDDFKARFEMAQERFRLMGVEAHGFALRGPWPEALASVEAPPELTFLSAPPGHTPKGPRLFPVETRPERDALRGGQTVRLWVDGVRAKLREAASLNKGVTVVMRPQVLAKVDPRLNALREISEFGISLGLRQRTLRELMAEG